MKPPVAEREEPAGPGAAAKAALRVVDAGLGFFQRLHNRLAGSESHDDRHGHAAERQEPETTAVAARPSLLRRLAIGLLLLLAGLGTGGYLAYRALSQQIKEHASVVERMQEEIDAVRKEDARNVKLMDKFQRENAEYRREAREAEREAESHKRRADELEAQMEEAKRAEDAKRAEAAKRAEVAAQKARREAASAARAKPSAPQKTGKCAVGGADDLSDCLEKFNSR
jgi:uncharacterized protein HemX